MLTAYLFYEMKDSHRCSKFLGIAHTEGDVWKANSKYWWILTGEKSIKCSSNQVFCKNTLQGMKIKTNTLTKFQHKKWSSCTVE